MAKKTAKPVPEQVSDHSSDESSDDEAAGMERLMELLKDVPAEELGLFPDDEEDLSGDSDEMEEEGSDSDEESEDLPPNDKSEAMLKVLQRFALPSDISFFETLTLNYPTPLVIPDASDDLKREVEFYKQSLWAAQQASDLHKKASMPFQRPQDYYAEMLKTDDHMERVRQKLIDESQAIKASEQAKKLREAKKYGKKVQVEKLKEREKSKRDMKDRVEAFKKKRKNALPGQDGEEFDISLADDLPSKSTKKLQKGGMSRDKRNTKYGRPQTSRRPKENDKSSVNDVFDGKRKPASRGRGAVGKPKGKARPGKSKRQGGRR